jgi:hypothetical protein
MGFVVSRSAETESEAAPTAAAGGYRRVMLEIFTGFFVLRLLAFIPLLIVIVVLVGVSALARGAHVLGFAILAGVPLIVAVALGWLLARRAGQRRR